MNQRPRIFRYFRAFPKHFQVQAFSHEFIAGTLRLFRFFPAQKLRSFMNIFMGWVFRTHVTLEKAIVFMWGRSKLPVMGEDYH